MHFDISRESFDARRNFTRVVLQQGRLIVDADWNEQQSILLHYLQSLAADLIGWHGGPNVAAGEGCFALSDPKKETITVRAGDYYIDGLRLHFDGLVLKSLGDIPWFVERAKDDNCGLILARVTESPLGLASEPDLADPALDGIETTGRVALRLSLLTFPFNAADLAAVTKGAAERRDFLNLLGCAERDPASPDNNAGGMLPQLTPSMSEGATPNRCEPQTSAIDGLLENQLYRVEIHRLGKGILWDGTTDPQNAPAGNHDQAVTLKWSRDNGSLAYAIRGNSGSPSSVTLLGSPFDDRGRIAPNDWVEILDPAEPSGVLARVHSVERATVRLEQPDQAATAQQLATLLAGKAPRLLRRWNHQPLDEFPLSEGGVLLKQCPNDPRQTRQIPLESGLQVQIRLPAGGSFRAGDYWLIPARVAAPHLLWPTDGGDTHPWQPQDARVPRVHYAPLAIVDDKNNLTDLRRGFAPLSKA